MNINIRLLLDSEIEAVNDVYNNAYGNIRPLDNFKWEFVNGPWGKAIYVIAEDLDKEGNKIIGTQSAIPMNFINGKEEIVLTAKSEDTFVHPDYRGHKLFDKMYDLLFSECRKVGIQYLWGFTYARKPFLKLGFSIPFETVQGVYIIKPKKSFNYLSSLNESNGFKEKFKIFGLVTVALLNRIAHQLNYSLNNNFVVGKDFLLKKILLDKCLSINNSMWAIHQTEKYINWRLKLNPFANDYLQYIDVGDSNKVNSAILVNYRKEGFAYVEEIVFTEPSSTKESLSLIGKVIQDSKDTESISMLRFWGFEGNEISRKEMSLLKRSGFVFIKKGTAFVWKDLSDGKGLIKPENILLSRLFTQGNK